MKYHGKNLMVPLLFLLTFGKVTTTYSSVVFLSGKPSSWQRETTEKFLSENHLNSESLIQWDLKNTNCLERTNAVLQLCFSKDKVYWVTARPEVLKRTFAHIISESDPSNEHKQKKPSKGGPL